MISKLTFLTVLTLILSVGVTAQHDKSMNKLRNELQNIVENNLINGELTPEQALNSILDFYNNYGKVEDLEFPDYDMLLFQYGTYDWDGTGAKFELNFTRQIADPDPEEDEFYQIDITLFYDPEDFDELESFNTWSIDSPSLNNWADKVKNTAGFEQSTKYKPKKFEIGINKT